MSSLSAYLLYNQEDVLKNQWFIDHIITCLSSKGCFVKLITTDQIYSYDSDNIHLNYSRIGFKPDFVINRSRDYILAHQFEKDGICVFNNSLLTKIANDKDLTYQHMINSSIDVLSYTVLSFDQFAKGNTDYILSIAESFGYPFVLKPAEGHGGFHVNFVQNNSDLLDEIHNFKNINSQSGLGFKKIIFQKPSSTLGKDLRVYVLGNKIICSIMRTSQSDFRANFSIGGNSCLYEPNDIEKNLIGRIITTLSGDFYGIDLIYNDSTPVLNELEDAVGTRMVYSNTNIDIAEEYINYIIKKMK